MFFHWLWQKCSMLWLKRCLEVRWVWVCLRRLTVSALPIGTISEGPRGLQEWGEHSLDSPCWAPSSFQLVQRTPAAGEFHWWSCRHPWVGRLIPRFTSDMDASHASIWSFHPKLHLQSTSRRWFFPVTAGRDELCSGSGVQVFLLSLWLF